MTDLTDDPFDPRLQKGQQNPVGMHAIYLVLSEDERKRGFERPYRDAYKHLKCGTVTTMGRELSETYARNPAFYNATYCTGCKLHLPLKEFTWTADGAEVGS